MSNSIAYRDFGLAILDAKLLRAFYDEQTKEHQGTPFQLDVLKRAGIILSITAWEAYIEDIITLLFEKRIEKADSPKDMQSAFNLVAEQWLNSKPKPPDLARWTSSGWILLLNGNGQEYHLNRHVKSWTL